MQSSKGENFVSNKRQNQFESSSSSIAAVAMAAAATADVGSSSDSIATLIKAYSTFSYFESELFHFTISLNMRADPEITRNKALAEVLCRIQGAKMGCAAGVKWIDTNNARSSRYEPEKNRSEQKTHRRIRNEKSTIKCMWCDCLETRRNPRSERNFTCTHKFHPTTDNHKRKIQ